MAEKLENRDQFDEQSERLLPCSMLPGCTNASDTSHNLGCIMWKRPSVAAALREQGKQIADLRAEIDKVTEDARAIVADYKASNENLRNDNLFLRDELERTKTSFGQSQADLAGCRDGALVRDLRAENERAKRLLTYAAPSVDHTCLAAETLGDHDCKRCAIDRLLDIEG